MDPSAASIKAAQASVILAVIMNLISYFLPQILFSRTSHAAFDFEFNPRIFRHVSKLA